MAQLDYPTESSQLTRATYRDLSSPPPKHEWISGAYQEAPEVSQHEGHRPRDPNPWAGSPDQNGH